MRIEIEIPKAPEMNKYTKKESYFCPGCDTEVTNCNYCPHGQKIDWSKIVKQGDTSDYIDNVCEWIKYDYRTICPKNHDTNNPYWRIPDNMDKLKYCPYCGKKILCKE